MQYLKVLQLFCKKTEMITTKINRKKKEMHNPKIFHRKEQKNSLNFEKRGVEHITSHAKASGSSQD